MNCKQGDLAIVVFSEAGNEGRIVTCVRLLGDRGVERSDGLREVEPVWQVDRLLTDWAGEANCYCPDSQLRPIRGNPGQDETLSWAEVPRKVEA